MHKQFIYRAPDIDGGGGGNPGPSLSDLGGGTDGFETSSGITLTAEEVAAKAGKQDGIAGNPDGTQLDAQGNPIVPDPNTPNPTLGPDGKPIDAGDAAQKVETDAEKTEREAKEAEEAAKAAEAGNTDDDEDPNGEKFLAAVDTLRGDGFDKTVKYPEGVIPTTPEGIYYRDQALQAYVIDQYEKELKEADPRGYAYLLHRQNGGSDEEFLGKKGFVLPDLNELKESVDLQREIYRQGLIAQGNSDKQAKALIEMAIKDGELAAEAEAMFKKIDENDKKELKRLNDDLELKAKAEEKTIKEFGDALNKEVVGGTNLKFIVPEAEKPKFVEALKQTIHYEDGKFFLIKPLSKDNLAEELQVELFRYLKGDLSKLVERKAKSIVSQKLSLTSKKGSPNPTGTEGQASGYTLGQL